MSVSWPRRALRLVAAPLRHLARLYPEGSVVRVPFGAAAGSLWPRHHRYVTSYWLGTYEWRLQRALRRFIVPSTVFYDVGANAGFFSLLVARHLGPDGLILAIDPLPENVNAISEVARVNRQDHIEVIAKAIASEEGEAELVDGGHSSTARLSSSSKSAGLPQNTMRVETTSLDQLSDVYPDPTVVKIDVEGAELDVLRGAQKVLGRARPVLFLELHDGVSRHEVHDILRSFSYTVSDLSGRAIDILAASPARHVLAQPSIQRTS